MAEATTKSFPVKGMHCASCASVIEKTLKKVAGVSTVSANYATETVKIDFNEAINPQTLSKKIKPFGYELVMDDTMENHHHEMPSEQTSLKLPLVIAGLSIIMMVWDTLIALHLLPEMTLMAEEFLHHLWPILATYIFVTLGRPYLAGLWRFIRYGKANMDTLIGLGTSVAFIYSLLVSAFEEALPQYVNGAQSYYDVTIVVIVFISLGKFLEARSKKRTGEAIQKLMQLQAKTALIIRNGQELEIPVEEVVVGDHIIIKPGAKIPVDGKVSEGKSYVDESMISGEPIPVSKHLNDELAAGTINTSGSFTMQATKVGKDTLLSHIITMVSEAQSSKAPIQALADNISAVFVPIVLILSFIALGTWIFIGPHYIGFTQSLSYGLLCFVGILVIACPCALGLATPTAIIVGVGKGAREGILIKDAATLQKLRSITSLVIDKTGTITRGKPEIDSIINQSKMTDEEIITLAASLEKKSEHPIAQAIVNSAEEKNLNLYIPKQFDSIKGKGIEGTIGERKYIIGSPAFIHENNVAFDEALINEKTKQGKTPVVFADIDSVLAVIFVSDQIKPESVEIIRNLQSLKINVTMMTGDNEQTARYIASQVGITEVIAQASPEDKMKKIKQLQSEGHIVAMAGDGVNDAPALAQADVGIAMATGTDVAIETAGITLLHGDIAKISKAINLSRVTMRGIKQNLFWAFIYNIIGIPLAGGVLFPFFGILLNPIFAGMAMALSSVSVVGNSLRLKTKKI